MVRSFPSEPRRKLSVALKTVRVLNGRLEPSRPMSCRFVLAPLLPISWHDEQLRELSRDKRGSPNRRSPSLTFPGLIGGGSGMGVIGSSATPDSRGWVSRLGGGRAGCQAPML